MSFLRPAARVKFTSTPATQTARPAMESLWHGEQVAGSQIWNSTNFTRPVCITQTPGRFLFRKPSEAKEASLFSEMANVLWNDSIPAVKWHHETWSLGQSILK